MYIAPIRIHEFGTKCADLQNVLQPKTLSILIHTCPAWLVDWISNKEQAIYVVKSNIGLCTCFPSGIIRQPSPPHITPPFLAAVSEGDKLFPSSLEPESFKSFFQFSSPPREKGLSFIKKNWPHKNCLVWICNFCPLHRSIIRVHFHVLHINSSQCSLQNCLWEIIKLFTLESAKIFWPFV